MNLTINEHGMVSLGFHTYTFTPFKDHSLTISYAKFDETSFRGGCGFRSTSIGRGAGISMDYSAEYTTAKECILETMRDAYRYIEKNGNNNKNLEQFKKELMNLAEQFKMFPENFIQENFKEFVPDRMYLAAKD